MNSPEDLVRHIVAGLAIDYDIPTATKYAVVDQLWGQLAAARAHARREPCSECETCQCAKRRAP